MKHEQFILNFIERRCNNILEIFKRQMMRDLLYELLKKGHYQRDEYLYRKRQTEQSNRRIRKKKRPMYTLLLF